MRLLNTSTGKTAEIDSDYARLARMRRRVKAWASRLKVHLGRLGKDYRLVMVTLTYAPGQEWEPNDVRDFMVKLRVAIGAKLLAYGWVAEMQKRGAVHYHVVLLVNRGTNIPMPDTIWGKGMTQIETARTPFYLLTYTGKEYQKTSSYPKGLRVFSVWIKEGVISDRAMWLFRLSALPAWLAEEMWKDGCFGEMPKRKEGGGWTLKNGEKFESYYSPWVVYVDDVEG